MLSSHHSTPVPSLLSQNIKYVFALKRGVNLSFYHTELFNILLIIVTGYEVDSAWTRGSDNLCCEARYLSAGGVGEKLESEKS